MCYLGTEHFCHRTIFAKHLEGDTTIGSIRVISVIFCAHKPRMSHISAPSSEHHSPCKPHRMTCRGTSRRVPTKWGIFRTPSRSRPFPQWHLRRHFHARKGIWWRYAARYQRPSQTVESGTVLPVSMSRAYVVVKITRISSHKGRANEPKCCRQSPGDRGDAPLPPRPPDPR